MAKMSIRNIHFFYFETDEAVIATEEAKKHTCPFLFAIIGAPEKKEEAKCMLFKRWDLSSNTGISPPWMD
jgi:hypothetical protein